MTTTETRRRAADEFAPGLLEQQGRHEPTEADRWAIEARQYRADENGVWQQCRTEPPEAGR